eukprot:gene22214-20332_t
MPSRLHRAQCYSCLYAPPAAAATMGDADYDAEGNYIGAAAAADAADPGGSGGGGRRRRGKRKGGKRRAAAASSDDSGAAAAASLPPPFADGAAAAAAPPAAAPAAPGILAAVDVDRFPDEARAVQVKTPAERQRDAKLAALPRPHSALLQGGPLQAQNAEKLATMHAALKESC